MKEKCRLLYVRDRLKVTVKGNIPKVIYAGNSKRYEFDMYRFKLFE
jgi:hypothetical protein